MFGKLKRSSQKNTSLLIAIGLGIGISLVFLPVVLISISQVVKAGEKRFTELEVTRTENIIQGEVNDTYKTLGDWSNWNDTYQFAQDSNQAFIDNNLADDTFMNLDVNMILILNTSNEIIFQKYFDFTTQSMTESPIDILAFLRSYSIVLDTKDLIGHKGLAYDQGHAMIVVSNPILTSMNKGPQQGTIIFILFLDKARLDTLSQLSLRTLDLYSADDPRNTSPTIPNAKKLTEDVFVYPRDADTIIGYKYLSDLNGHPALILKVENPRELFLQGRTTLIIVLGILLCLIVLLCVISYYFTRSVLNARERKKEEETAEKLLEKTRQDAIELEKRVEERTKELEIKNKDLETFNYTVSHDLKSPLRGISGYSTLLMKEHSARLDKVGMNYLKNLVDAAARMSALIEDLLSYTKTERRDLVYTEVDLEILVDSLVAEHEGDITKRNIEVKKNLECDHLFIDRAAITLILRNLLDNAIKFTLKNNQPTIIFDCKVAQDLCTISVTDNGIGFDMKFHDKIFDIFQRLHLLEEYPGTGIGLALVKKAAERLGGKVYAKSEPGVGSTFFIDIPRRSNF